MTDPTAPTTELTEIVVTGRRIRFEWDRPQWIVPPIITNPGDNEVLEPVDPSEGPPPPCLSTVGMTDEQKLQKLLEFALAVWREKLATDPSFAANKEWGSYFYIDSGGELKWTTPKTGPSQTADFDISSFPTLASGNPDYSRIVAVAHSHPRFNVGTDGPNTDYADPNDPHRLLRPSLPHVDWTGTNQPGDWAAYNSVNAWVDYQASWEGGPGKLYELKLVIVGWRPDGSANGGDLAINEYGAADAAMNYGSNGFPPGGASHGGSGSKGSLPTNPLPPCSD